MRKRSIAVFAIAFLCAARAACAQQPPPTLPLPGASPAAAASPSPAPAPSLAPAGMIPATVALHTTGSPADPAFLETQIRGVLNRSIRPTLRPGASVSYGPFVPWPLLPLVPGQTAAVNVTVTITGDAATAGVTGTTTVVIDNTAVPPATPAVLYLSDDPEYLQANGLVFQGTVDPGRPARLYYYQDDIGVPRDLDVVLTAKAPARVHVIASRAGPDLDVMSVGHTVSRDFLLFQRAGEGIVVDLEPGKPFIVRHDLLLQGEVVAGAIDLQVLNGEGATVSVVASAAGGRPEAYLDGPRIPLDGHHRHGRFDLTNYGDIAATYTVGGPDVSVKYGGTTPTLRNLDAGDPGRDYGDYGVVHRITFTLANPTGDEHLVYLYEKPLGGPVRSTFFVDGQLKELGCVRLRQPYWLMTYRLPPHSTGASTTLTMTDGGSFYPIELGVSATQPIAYTPPPGTPDGCSPVVSAPASPPPSVSPSVPPSPSPWPSLGPNAGR
ncbi:MAG TPA: hypothetical protein VMA36_09475 [Candidatus Limnocylindria bacterium]|nr:hypothetical protein [Candidatus Limnocylindria bacterium]